MAREGLKLELPAAVRAAHHSQQLVVRRGLNVRTNGDQSLLIVGTSVEFARRFGTTEPHLVGKPLSELGSGWRNAALTARLGTLTRGEPCPPFRVQGSLGAPLPVDVVIHPRRLRTSHPGARYLLVLQEAASSLPAAISVD